MSAGDDGGFASRWSQRKAASRQEEAAPDEEAALREEAGPRDDFENMGDAEILRELGLPDPDTLGEGADFKAFMTSSVPGHIRSRALRQLWRSNPVLANVDGLVDYGGDFTDKATVVENLQTAYEVGRGFARRLSELAGEAEEQDQTGPAGDAALTRDEASGGVADVAETGPEDAGPEGAGEDAGAGLEGGAPARRQRMQFAFDGKAVGDRQVS